MRRIAGYLTDKIGKTDRKQTQKNLREYYFIGIFKRQALSRENPGKFFFDLAKLVFTSMALVGGVSLIVSEARIQQGILATIGVSLTYTFAAIGYKILNR